MRARRATPPVFFPLFRALTHAVNPVLEEFQNSHPVSVAATDCSFHRS